MMPISLGELRMMTYDQLGNEIAYPCWAAESPLGEEGEGSLQSGVVDDGEGARYIGLDKLYPV
jgi:hypothetical protein